MKQSIVNFHKLAMHQIRTYQVHNNHDNFTKFMKLSWLSRTNYELNWSYQVHKNAWPFRKLSILWTSWTKSWTTSIDKVCINIHDLSWTVFDEQFVNTFHELAWWPTDKLHFTGVVLDGSGRLQAAVHVTIRPNMRGRLAFVIYGLRKHSKQILPFGFEEQHCTKLSVQHKNWWCWWWWCWCSNLWV